MPITVITIVVVVIKVGCSRRQSWLLVNEEDSWSLADKKKKE
jgi:hypothetical protein